MGLEVLPWSEQLLRLHQQTDFSLWLDERGTPGADLEFVTGGLLVYGDRGTVEAAASTFLTDSGLGRVKGTKLSREQALDVSAFIISQPAIPVGVHTVLDVDILARTRSASRAYERRESPRKAAPKISPAGWIWKTQMNATMMFATVTAMCRIGPIRSLSIHLDKISDTDEHREHYHRLMHDKLTPEARRRNTIVGGLGGPLEASLVEGMGGEPWTLDLRAKGPLALLADHVCALYGRYREGTGREPWEVLRVAFERADMPFPPCIGGDATPEVRAFLVANADWATPAP